VGVTTADAAGWAIALLLGPVIGWTVFTVIHRHRP
jgi:hypothetical protein